jgi:hypothetical protein
MHYDKVKWQRTRNYLIQQNIPRILYLFTVFLMTVSVTQTKQHKMVGWIITGKGCWRKQPWPDLKYHPGICLQGLRKTIKNQSQDSQYQAQDLNTKPPKYKAEVIPTQLQHSAEKNCNFDNHNRKRLNMGVSGFVSIMLNAKSQKKNNIDDHFEESVQEFLTSTKEARNICKSHLSSKPYISEKGTKMLIPTHLLHKKQDWKGVICTRPRTVSTCVHCTSEF